MTDRAQQVIDAVDRLTREMTESLMRSCDCCPNCMFWLEKQELCRNEVCCPNGPQRPPATIIAFGCNKFIGAPPF